MAGEAVQPHSPLLALLQGSGLHPYGKEALSVSQGPGHLWDAWEVEQG